MKYRVLAEKPNGDYVNFVVDVPEGSTIEEVVYSKIPTGDWSFIYVKETDLRDSSKILTWEAAHGQQ